MGTGQGWDRIEIQAWVRAWRVSTFVFVGATAARSGYAVPGFVLHVAGTLTLAEVLATFSLPATLSRGLRSYMHSCRLPTCLGVVSHMFVQGTDRRAGCGAGLCGIR